MVNEDPDSDETMTLFVEDLLNKLNVKMQDGWVVFVGDGKPYQHLLYKLSNNMEQYLKNC